MPKNYRDVAAKLQQSVQKHLSENKELSSSEEDEPSQTNVLHEVLLRYTSGGGDGHLLNRTKELLEEAISGRSVICLICIGSIKRPHPIWTCGHCFCYFHLTCIQKWSNDSINMRTAESLGRLVYKSPKIEWCCPKCRYSYSKDEIPRKYVCFCSKTVDPPFHPWLLPHSCGETCQKQLSTGSHCKHKCLLLCHPGPCPPCPQTINGACHCAKEHKRVRCCAPKWSCGKTCKKFLTCNTHQCEEICHEGDCSPCSYSSIQKCQCGAEEMRRPCSDPNWQCQKVCNKSYDCHYHKCEKVCHADECGPCPYSGNRTCPCGATARLVQCPEIMETCLGTCGKSYDTCDHSCSDKCHRGACPPCQVLVEKKCLCGAHTKFLPCSKEFKCDAKCRLMRSCGKHVCGRKCCNGECPPCEKICQKPLQCGQHKCVSICHLGPCYPCSRESSVTCACKGTSITVPCGRNRTTKPPKCNLPCKIKYKCGHKEENTHICHFGDCPPCKAVCLKTYEKCQHQCKATCHEYVAVVFQQVEKPATPWEKQPPQIKIMTLECPPCDTPVPVTCFGEHDTQNQPCHAASRRRCGRECGRPLPCGNHKCTLPCHLLQYDPSYPIIPHACEPCGFECIFPRPEKCTHKCAKGACHSGECPPCEIIERIPCHCKVTELYISCKELCTATDEILSCKQQCPKNLECGHRCKNNCHPGNCKNQVCTKKAKAYCSCGNIKKELPCYVARNGENKIACDGTCEEKKIAMRLQKEQEERRRREIEEEKNRKELAEYEWKLSGKKKKYKEKKSIVNQDKRNLLQKHWILVTSVLTVLIAGTYLIFY